MKVRELEWKELRGVPQYRAETSFGRYHIFKALSGWTIYWRNSYLGFQDTPAEAKQACQEDFNERVMKCLCLDDSEKGLMIPGVDSFCPTDR